MQGYMIPSQNLMMYACQVVKNVLWTDSMLNFTDSVVNGDLNFSNVFSYGGFLK